MCDIQVKAVLVLSVVKIAYFHNPKYSKDDFNTWKNVRFSDFSDALTVIGKCKMQDKNKLNSWPDFNIIMTFDWLV